MHALQQRGDLLVGAAEGLQSECAGLVLPADRVDTVAQMVESLDTCPDLRSLTAILDPGR